MGWIAGLAVMAVVSSGCTAERAAVQPDPTNTTAPPPPTTTTAPPPVVSRPVAVSVSTVVFTDPSRPTPGRDGGPAQSGRRLETRLWRPASRGPRPLVLLAHGLGGEPEKFGQLATSWARAGYVVAAPRFPRSSFRNGNDPSDLARQPADISFVLDELLARADLAIDEQRVALAGMSLGGATAYAIALDRCCRDPRFRAVAVLAGVYLGPSDDSDFALNDVPVLVVHCDGDPSVPFAQHARRGYAALRAPSWLVTMRCNEHSAPFEDAPSELDGLVADATLALWDATIGSAPGSAALERVAQAATLGGRSSVESRP